MKSARPWTRIALASMTVLLSACASKAGTTPTTDTSAMASGAVSIQVTNDLIPPSAVTLWIAPESGSRRRLGTLSPNGQQTFSFSPDSPTMDFHLVAERSGSAAVTSDLFTLGGVQSVRWSLSLPAVSVVRRN